MAGQGVVSIGLQIEHSKALDAMLSNFRDALKQMENTARRVKWDENVIASFEAIKEEIGVVESGIKTVFDKLNSQELKADSFKEYQELASSRFSKIETDIKGLSDRLNELGDNDYVSKIVNQFNELHESVKQTYVDLGKVVNFTSSTNVIDLDIVRQVAEYEKAINKIKKLKDSAELPDIDVSSNENIKKAITAYDEMYKAYELLEDKEAELKNKLSVSSGDDRLQAEQELYVHRQKMINQFEELEYAYKKIKKIDKDGSLLGTYDDPEIFDPRASFSGGIDKYIKDCSEFIQQNEKMVESYRETQSQLDALVTEFKLKNGAIHVPIEIDKINETHKNQLMSALNKLQAELDKKNIIAKVKLTLDDGSSKGRKKNADFDQQQKDGQKKPVADLTPSIAKAYREGAKIAEETVKAGMAEIQKAFEKVPVTFKLDTDAFKTNLKAMIDDSFKAIAEDTTGLNVNSELEKLVGNLKEVSSSISGNENFKFGLDEASIERITAAIKDMADMIQRAFGVASNEDIAAQWTAIESKFKGVAGEEGKLLKGNKEHKVAIQELAVEYKKYLDMGGKNDLSTLTAHKQTVKNITAEYENLGKAAQEAAQKQEKVAKKPASKKVSSEETEDIKGVTRDNKKLETQAGKTGAALDNEGKKAQSAGEKFRKLAKEKGAAVVANRELAKAAKETADALEREANIRKASEPKQSKNAVEGNVYNNNFSKWQREIKQSLIDSGNYAEVYEAKITQATNGTVKFTAAVLDLTDRKLKKFSAKVNGIGEIFAPSLDDMNEKEVALFEKRQRDAQRVIDAMAAMDGSGDEKTFLDRTELEQSIATLIEAEAEIDRFKVKKVSLEEGGRLSITTEVKEANGQVKEFVATFDSIGDIIDAETGNIKEFVDVTTGELKSLGDILENKFDRGKFTVKMPNVTESTSLNQRELWQYLSAIEKAAHELENADTKYSVSLGSDGTVHITKEIQKANGEVKIFKGEFKDVNDLIDTTTGSVKDLGAALRDGFDSGKVTTKTRNVMQEAQDAFDLFTKSGEGKSGFKYISEDVDKLKQKIKEIKTLDGLKEFNDDLYKLVERLKLINSAESFFDKTILKHEGSSGWDKVSEEVDNLRKSIASIKDEHGLNEVKQNLIDIIKTLNSVGKDNKLGEIIGGDRTFKDINEVRANIDSLFASMGKVNEKSIRVKGTDKLTAEVKAANGEIRKITVSLDSNKFARYVDNGIVQFGRLRAAAEGVFKGIQSMVRIYLSPQDFIRYFRQGFDKVKEIDTAMTELKKVSDASPGDIANYFGDAVTSAKELGSSVNDMISATADWSRNGYNLPDSKELAEVAVLYKNVGDGIDIDAANSSLVSTLQGFQMDASEAIDIVDKFNEVAKYVG